VLVFRCAAGALNRDTSQAGKGNRCVEPQAPLCPRLSRDCRHFAAGELKVVQCGPPLTGNPRSWHYRQYQHFWRLLAVYYGLLLPLIYTDAYTFVFENLQISLVVPNKREQPRLGLLISGVISHSFVRIKMLVREGGRFDSDRRTNQFGDLKLSQNWVWITVKRA
jgi:hypothetical protein